jgi:Putative adhesin
VTTIAPPPAPPVTPQPGSAPPLSAGGRTVIRVLLIGAAAVLVLGSLGALSVAALGLSTFRVITDTKPLPPAMRSLVIDTGRLPVAVRITTDRAATEPRADMRMINSTRAGEHPLTVTADGADTRIAISGEASPFLQWGRAGEIKVVLPPELARRLAVTSRQENGVLMAQADIDQLTANTENGAILLSGSARRVEVHTDSGDVITRSAIAVTDSFSATTDNGDVEVDFTNAAPPTVEATSDNGDIRIGLPPRGPYLVNANTGNERGSTVVRVPRTTNGEAAAAVITARTENGDIVVDNLR